MTIPSWAALPEDPATPTKRAAKPAPPPAYDAATIAAKIRATAEEAVTKEITAMDVTSIRAAIVERLRRDQSTVILKVLGMNDSWGKWEVDRTNGRESPITRYLEEHCGSVIRETLVEMCEEVLASFDKNKLRAQVRDGMIAHVQQMTDRNSYRSTIQEAAEGYVKGIVADVKAEIFKTEE